MKNTIEKYELTKSQIEACKQIERAFANAKKLGVRFLAKQYDITAYKKNAFDNKIELHESTQKYGEYLPYYRLRNCIADSGADDMERFPKGFIDKDEDDDEEYTELRAERLRVINQNLLEDYTQTYGNLIDGK